MPPHGPDTPQTHQLQFHDADAVSENVGGRAQQLGEGIQRVVLKWRASHLIGDIEDRKDIEYNARLTQRTIHQRCPTPGPWTGPWVIWYRAAQK